MIKKQYIKNKNFLEPKFVSAKIVEKKNDPDACRVSNQLGCKIVEGPTLYESIRDAVVMISVKGQNDSQWQGTGFFVTPDGYIVTAAHVITESVDTNDDKGAIKPAKEIYVLVSPNYDVYRCRVVGIDGTGDIGLLKIDMDDPFNRSSPSIQNQRYLPFLDKANTGELAFVLGYPLGTDLASFSMGIVRNERFVAPSLFIPFNVVLITSPAYQGNSGSPIVNVNGEVIGLLTFVYYANEQTFESIGGGPSSSIVSYVIKRLIDADDMSRRGEVMPAYFDQRTLKYKKGYLGFESTKVVWFSDIPMLVQKYNFPQKQPIGFRGQISKNSPLKNIISNKDIIVRIDGKEIGALPSQTAPGDILWHKVPGDKVRIEYYPMVNEKYGPLKSVDIVLQDYPDNIDTFEGRALKVEMECIGDECSLASKYNSRSDDFWLPSSSKPVGF
jgi:S1-C subfamily serine protease